MNIRLIATAAIIPFLFNSPLAQQEYNPLREFAYSKAKIAYMQWNSNIYDTGASVIVLDIQKGKSYKLWGDEENYNAMFSEDGKYFLYTRFVEGDYIDEFGFNEINSYIFRINFITGENSLFLKNKKPHNDSWIEEFCITSEGIYFTDIGTINYVSNDMHSKKQIFSDNVVLSNLLAPKHSNQFIFSLKRLGSYNINADLNTNDSLEIYSYTPSDKKFKKLFTIGEYEQVFDYSLKSGELIYSSNETPVPHIFNVKTGVTYTLKDSLHYNSLFLSPRKAYFYTQNEMILICAIMNTALYAQDIFIYDLNKKEISKQLTFDGLLKSSLVVYKEE